MSVLHKFEITTLPMVTKTGLQQVDIQYHIGKPAHLFLSVYRDGQSVV